MPFVGEYANEIGLASAEGLVCVHDVENGHIKNAQAIFEGGVQFFLSLDTQYNRALAERLTRKNMQSLPYWQQHPFAALDGQTATDEEFAAAMAKM